MMFCDRTQSLQFCLVYLYLDVQSNFVISDYMGVCLKTVRYLSIQDIESKML